MNTDERLTLTCRETARLLGCHENSIYTWIREHKLPSIRLGRKVLIPRAGLAAMLRASVIKAEVDDGA